jgi:branched-chain amino acid transport system permease protein
VSFDMGGSLGLKGFVAATLGGIGSVPGAVVGGILIGVIESVGAGLFSSGWRDAIVFAVLIVVLFVRPEGLFGRSVARV